MFIQINEHTLINMSSINEIMIDEAEIRFFQNEDLEPTVKVFKTNEEARAFMTKIVKWTMEDEDAEEFLY